VGITEVTLSRYITGQRSPKAETVTKIATILHTSSDYLMGKDNQVRGTDYWETYFLIKKNKDEWSENQKAALIIAMFHKDTDNDAAQGFSIDLNKDSNPGQSQ
jgi:transcriptional regulator with XRE-family HTH domain